MSPYLERSRAALMATGVFSEPAPKRTRGEEIANDWYAVSSVSSADLSKWIDAALADAERKAHGEGWAEAVDRCQAVVSLIGIPEERFHGGTWFRSHALAAIDKLKQEACDE